MTRASSLRRLGAALRPIRALEADGRKLAAVARRRGAAFPWLSACADPSLWALALMRGSAALRASLGSSFGLSQLLRVGFHIDVWSDDIGPGLRLPHPFNIVIGEGARVGKDCVLLHNVTVQRGLGTSVGDGAVLATGAVVLAGAQIGEHSLVGAGSIVRGVVPPRSVAVGAPARVVRNVRESEVVS